MKVKAIQTQYGDYGQKMIGDEWVVTEREAKALVENKLVEVTDKKSQPDEKTESKGKSNISVTDNTGKKK